LQVTPDELRSAAGVFDRAGNDVKGAQARRLDSLFSSAASAAGDHALAGALLWCASDYADIAKAVGGMVTDQAGKLRDAANKYERGDAAGAGAITTTPLGATPSAPLLKFGVPQ
jgi:hypothetical protein